jgi:hypothetical protein
MKMDRQSRTSFIAGSVLIGSAVLIVPRVYVVRELVVELLLFCLFYFAIGVAVIILRVIDELIVRVFRQIRTQLNWTHFHFNHGTHAGATTSATHKG